MNFIDYYEVLQISSTASPEIIKAAYRQLSKMYHPDTNDLGEQEFILIKEAYDILSEKQRRKEYDILWRQNKKSQKSDTKIDNNTLEEEMPPVISKQNVKPLIGISIFFIIIFSIAGCWNKEYGNLTSTPLSSPTKFLTTEEYSKINTTAYIFNYGEAIFEIYNGTDSTITDISIAINIKNESGDIIETRNFQKNVSIIPFTEKKDIKIITDICDLPSISKDNLSIDPKYISWDFTAIQRLK